LLSISLFGCIVVVLLVVRKGQPSSPSPTSTQSTSFHTPGPISLSLTPEQTACIFLSVPNLDECRSKVKFDTVHNAGDAVIGFTIPSEIGLLTNLTYFDITSEQLNSTIPSEIGLLQQLTVLSFGSNHLTSTIPSEIGLLLQLTFLYFAYNLLTSTIPTEIGTLNQLTYLDFRSNCQCIFLHVRHCATA
jgi:hypothetical protein